MCTIKTPIGEYNYEAINLYHGRKKLDRLQCKKNLLIFKKTLDKNNIKFGLIYGTLLGAVRERNFIEHDEDVDVFILEEDKKRFLNILFELRNNKLDVVRYDGSLLSLMGGNDYIDVYFFKKKYFIYRKSGVFIHRSYYFKNDKKIEFLNTKFNAPNDHIKFLEEMYGKDWRVPKLNSFATPYTLKYKLKKKLKRLYGQWS